MPNLPTKQPTGPPEKGPETAPKPKLSRENVADTSNVAGTSKAAGQSEEFKKTLNMGLSEIHANQKKLSTGSSVAGSSKSKQSNVAGLTEKEKKDKAKKDKEDRKREEREEKQRQEQAKKDKAKQDKENKRRESQKSKQSNAAGTSNVAGTSKPGVTKKLPLNNQTLWVIDTLLEYIEKNLIKGVYREAGVDGKIKIYLDNILKNTEKYTSLEETKKILQQMVFDNTETEEDSNKLLNVCYVLKRIFRDHIDRSPEFLKFQNTFLKLSDDKVNKIKVTATDETKPELFNLYKSCKQEIKDNLLNINNDDMYMKLFWKLMKHLHYCWKTLEHVKYSPKVLGICFMIFDTSIDMKLIYVPEICIYNYDDIKPT